MLPISDRTLAELLEKRLQDGRAFHLFARRLGPGDVVYLSAFAFGPDGNVVEVKASAFKFADALVQLFNNLDLATSPQ
jgi:hypothetical protein